jgi:magnesium transporter
VFQKYYPPTGSSPGTLAAPPDALETKITIARYGLDFKELRPVADVDELTSILEGRDPSERLWVHVEGLKSVETLARVGQIFRVHPLALEDAVNVPHRPSIQSFEHQDLIVAWTVRLSAQKLFGQSEAESATTDESTEVISEDLEGLWCDPDFAQIAIFFGEGYVLTIAERPERILEPIRERLRAEQSRMRSLGTDYLAYAILDAVVDSYYPVMERLGEHLDELETIAFVRPRQSLLKEIHSVRRVLLHLRKGIWPLRDALSGWQHNHAGRLSDTVRIYLRDTYDHSVQLVDVIESYREAVSELLNTYLSALAQRTNEVMKTLTMMSSIFIPLTFLAGLYGMNFHFMPELRWKWSYPILLAIMLAVVVILLRYFRERGWLGGNGD